MSEQALENLSFEAAFAELEKLVKALEGNQVQLEEALQLFEKGQKLSAYCQGLLDKADLRVSQLIGDKLTPLDD